MISGAFVFQSLTLHPTANPVEPSRKPDPFTITPVVRPLKTPSVAFWRKKRKKTRKHQAKPEKRVRIVFRALHNYARKRCAIGFVRSEHRTAQNDKFSPPGAWRSDGVSCFQTSHLARTKKKPTWGRWQESESMGNILVIGCSIFTNAKNASVMP